MPDAARREVQVDDETGWPPAVMLRTMQKWEDQRSNNVVLERWIKWVRWWGIWLGFLIRFLGRDPVSGFKILKTRSILKSSERITSFLAADFLWQLHKHPDSSNRFIHTKKTSYLYIQKGGVWIFLKLYPPAKLKNSSPSRRFQRTSGGQCWRLQGSLHWWLWRCVGRWLFSWVK